MKENGLSRPFLLLELPLNWEWPAIVCMTGSRSMIQTLKNI